VGEGEGKEWRIGGQEVKQVIEGLVLTIWRAAGKIAEADRLEREGFGVLRYDEAMRRFGSDKPDLRYGVELVEIGEAFDTLSKYEEEDDAWKEREEVELLCFTPPNGSLSNSDLEQIFQSNKEVLSGVERFKVGADQPNVMAKLLIRKSANVRRMLEGREVVGEDVDVSMLVHKIQEAQSKGSMLLHNVPQGDSSFLFTATKTLPASSGSTKLGDLRRLLMEALIKKGHLQLSTQPHFTWITEFPLFTLTDSDKAELSKGRWSSTHHPFTSPMERDISLVREALSPSSTMTSNEKQRIMHTSKGQHYDLVLNGVEIGGGSIRIHDAKLQELILGTALQLTPSELHRFDHLLQALRCGAPPHGGIALGLDRLMSILCDTSTIRDVIAFPKSASSKDLLFQCPDGVDSSASLEAYGLKPATAR
jgi:aspartyl-tRNA synthetase